MALDLSVTSEYFKTMGIPVIKGRGFDPARDRADAVAVVSQSLVRKCWPNQEPIGQILESPRTMPREVIGVVGDTRDVALDQQIFPSIYSMYGGSDAATSITLVVRTTANAAQVGEAVRSAVRASGKDVVVDIPRTLSELMARSIAERRFNLLLFGVFAAVGLLLASIGVYAIVTYSVGQRTREIGIRLALGAQARHIRAAVAGSVLRWLVAGTIVGIVAALGLSRFLQSLLYQLTPTDFATFASVAILLVAVAAAAAAIPARRAVRIDPATAMRTE
jgi:putative ABC transport system permease protein